MVFPRVIATDLDGTLLGLDGRVSERNRRALTAAVAAGVKLVLSTARPPRTTHHIASLFTCSAVLCGNGAVAQLPGADPLIRALDTATAGTVIGELRGALPGVGFGVETGTDFYHDPHYDLEPWVPRDWVREVVDSTDTLLERARPITKLLVRSQGVPVHILHETAAQAVGTMVEVTYSGGFGLLEMSASGVDKGSTLAMVCERWGVSADEVVAFGDMPNDLPALSWAGAGYAMASGHPALLDPALGLRTAPPAHEDGVGRIVEQLLT
ncbi:HAD family hydrolase [Nocardiopsis changdeensis]|uniref:HAD family phosphatase n=1 Tax=Nocardiopsis changdeensis TaxID=2831969 RepID=A0ABX8BQK8_9ACTN|nr:MULTISPECIES: HAD family hydrolase [Nocardiopsis]QKW32228.1 HAD family phosphatase [Nocardiopsis flavescens]QUX23549.1 HAD family phosphatase [Nocardiopsis changdeensis]QYX39493.1 Cof-type HAD-IIB family hydrolase [Nocardiopsis sp. MT53]